MGMKSIFGQWGRLGTGRMWENRHVGAGGESARSGTAFGVEREIGGGRGL